MQRSIHTTSFFGGIVHRELDGLGGRKRPYLGDLSSEPGGPGAGGVVSVEHQGSNSLPLAASFCKTSKNAHLLAVGDEDGYVSFYDTQRRICLTTSWVKKAEEAKVCEWVAHNNAIFDVCWIKDDCQILTASGEQKIKLWDTESRKCVGILVGHSGSIKSISPHASNPDVVASGSRDGSFALWDLRCKPSSTRNGEACLLSVAVVERAHSDNKRSIRQLGVRNRTKTAPISITSVLYLKDAISIATSGALNSVVKFWDTRNLKSAVTQTCPSIGSSVETETGGHGISSLSQDSHGVFIAASCMDDRIYLFDVLHLNKGASKVFSGSKIDSFYVKTALSPDGAHLLAGSGDGNAYIWQVQKPESTPVKLSGHEGEVTSVDWCSSEVGKLATCADDFMIRIWNIKKGSCISTMSPNSLEKRAIKARKINCRKLVLDESSEEKAAGPPPASPLQVKEPQFCTPKSERKRNKIEVPFTPEGSDGSPSSVLNPPLSLKRKTILDYFASAS